MNITLSIQVDAPVEHVFGVFADLAGAQERLTNVTRVELLTPGPIGVGTRWRETRRMLGQEATEEMAVSAFEPPHSYEVIVDSHGARYHTAFRFAGRQSGTEVTMDFDAKAVSLGARLMSVTGILFRSATEKALLTDLQDLKRACEAR